MLRCSTCQVNCSKQPLSADPRVDALESTHRCYTTPLWKSYLGKITSPLTHRCHKFLLNMCPVQIQADLFGARLVTPPAPPMQRVASETPVKSSVHVRRFIPDRASLIIDILNYLAVEGEKLHSSASHLLFAKGSPHHLG